MTQNIEKRNHERQTGKKTQKRMYKNCLRVEDDSDREWETENVEHYRKRNFN